MLTNRLFNRKSADPSAASHRGAWLHRSLWGLALAACLTAPSAALGQNSAQPVDSPARRIPATSPSAETLSDDDSASATDATTEQALIRLTFSPDPKVRRSALESISQLPPNPELLSRVKKVADSDENSVVRGYARLLVTDWQTAKRPVRRSAKPNIPQEKTATRSRTPAAAPAKSSEAASSTTIPVASDEAGERPRPLSSPLNGTSPPTAKRRRAGTARPAEPPGREPEGMEPASFESAPGEPAGADATTRSRTEDPLFAVDNDAIEDLSTGATPETQPGFLAQPNDAPFGDFSLEETDVASMFRLNTGTPLGFTGPSGILPTEDQESSHFVPVEDRWRNPFPQWDRYGKGHPWGDDYPYVEGHWWDPYNQNVLKGDYPIFGQHTFLNVTGVASTFQEFRQLPTVATGRESTMNPFTNDFFGNPNQYFTTNFFRLKFDLFHGSGSFKPVDWRIVLESAYDMNNLAVKELGIVNPDVRRGANRYDQFLAFESYFVEAKLADLSPDYDFMSVRLGTQPFVSDFRGFIFADNNRGVRLFGTRLANRDQFNVVAFDQLEKDTNSGLNTFDDRHQWIVIANYSRQDFLFPGYTAQLSFHYDNDGPSVKYDENDDLVRPDPAGVAMPHKVQAFYYGFAGDGHIGRFNFSHAAYWVRGNDTMNPIAGRPIQIDAQMAAAEISYDRDWVRFRTSYFYASGQHEANSAVGKGFDSIFDNPNFAGGRFSFWQRQPIKLLGVNLKQKESLVPDLRSSKIEGQANFSNPGLQLVNAGMDFQVSPNCRVFTNANYLWFDATQVLEQFVFQKNISRQIGTDLSIGTEYRPFLNDNVVILAGYAALLPGNGLNELYGTVNPYNYKNPQAQGGLPALNAVFLELALTY
ncbi:MAG: hypothetical protein JSS02_08360 [Planctomycetes bacterium]|nr:hypothetical protein [Planctomycetota bacterium]